MVAAVAEQSESDVVAAVAEQSAADAVDEAVGGVGEDLAAADSKLEAPFDPAPANLVVEIELGDSSAGSVVDVVGAAAAGDAAQAAKSNDHPPPSNSSALPSMNSSLPPCSKSPGT